MCANPAQICCAAGNCDAVRNKLGFPCCAAQLLKLLSADDDDEILSDTFGLR
jgi:hypothetical protein